MMDKILITTVPFGVNSTALNMLNESGYEYVINPIGRKLSEDELFDMVDGYTAIIAGTEVISRRTIEKNSSLKLISRVGIGLDGVDLLAARENGVAVSYTPDAPSPAAAELTLGLMLSVARSIHAVNSKIEAGVWERLFGTRLALSTIGIVGCGRIGSRLIRLLSGFDGVKILANDLIRERVPEHLDYVSFASYDEILRESDIITFHVPLNSTTYGMASSDEISLMKEDVTLINVARGGVIEEKALYSALKSNPNMSAAIDVFENEPYTGELAQLDNCLLTSHMGSMTIDCRSKMEEEATRETIQFLTNGVQSSAVPEDEYAQR